MFEHSVSFCIARIVRVRKVTMRSYEVIAISKSVAGKVSLSDVSKIAKNHFGIAPRTTQKYMLEGILPKPGHRVWNSWFYTTEVATEVLARAYLIMRLRQYKTIPFPMIKSIFKRYGIDINALINKLLPIADTYRWYESIVDPNEPVFNERHAKVMRRVCEMVDEGVPLDKINADEIAMDYIRTGE